MCYYNTVGFHNLDLRIFNLRVSNPNDCGCFFDTMSDFNVPRSRPKKNTMKFRKSTVIIMILSILLIIITTPHIIIMMIIIMIILIIIL